MYKFSIITINFNCERFLEETMQSVFSQKIPEVELEYIVVDGGSTDGSMQIIDRYRSQLTHVISEPDNGPANALNKGLKLATGDIIAWLNADDCYFAGTFERVLASLKSYPKAAFYFGACPIVDEHSQEIRHGITRFKEAFFPYSSRFLYRCINYISQPALFFRREAFNKAGYIDENMIAAWDYKFVLGLWHYGQGIWIPGPPLARFRWHESSISGKNFSIQFKEEYESVRQEAGGLHPAVIIHYLIRWLIVGSYSIMAWKRKRRVLKG